MTNPIGKLERVPLREVWKHEAYDFTQWLQQNIDILNDSLDLSLVSAEREQAAGNFSIDLVAEDEEGATYVIENQLERSDHDHLGKLITYLTARTARAGIWIVAEPRPEHVAAIAWLNESANADFYLIKVEALRIGDSPAAPLLTLISGPSVEAKETGRAKQEVNARHEIYKRWWTALLANPGARLHAHLAPRVVAWLGTSSGTQGFQYVYATDKYGCSAQLYIDRGKGRLEENKRIFDHFYQLRDQVETRISYPMIWERLENSRACRVIVRLPNGIHSPEDEWPQIQTELIDVMNQLEAAFRPILQDLRIQR